MTTTHEPVTYADFGPLFVRTAVTPARVAESVVRIAGETVEFGPIEAGPGGVATANATGRVRDIVVTPLDGEELLAFSVSLDIELDLEVLVSERRSRFRAEVEVPLHLTVTTAAPLALLIDATPPRSRDVRVKVHAHGMQAKMVGKIGAVDVQVCQHAARYVRERLEHPDARAAMTIDLVELVDRAWPENGARENAAR